MTFFKKIKDRFIDLVNFNKDEAVSGKKSEVGKEVISPDKQSIQRSQERDIENKHSDFKFRKKYKSGYKNKNRNKSRMSDPEKVTNEIPNSGYRKRENVSSDNSENQKKHAQENKSQWNKSFKGAPKKRPAKDS